MESSSQQISKAIIDLGNISKGMNSELITNQGLIEVLKKETNRLKELDLFELSYSINGSPVFMDSQKELVIFRIIQEAFNNIIKHAKATLVKLNLEYNTDHINVLITDNGNGFCKEEVERIKTKNQMPALLICKKEPCCLTEKQLLTVQ
jgi:signal transduction histidine kinase